MSALRARAAAFGPVASYPPRPEPTLIASSFSAAFCKLTAGFFIGVALVFWWIFQLE